MKRILYFLFLALCATTALWAQTPAATPPAAAAAPQSVVPTVPVQIRIGYLSYDSLLHAMPEYATVQANLLKLRQQYASETEYNEQNFKRMFTDFLQGQKDFPQPILLKRQQDLQEEMEKGLSFRHRCDSLLAAAQKAMMQPLRARLDAAIRAVGLERDYEMMLNTDAGAVPFLRPSTVENAAPYIMAKLAPTSAAQ